MQNLRQKTAYSGCALSLIDALSTLAVIADHARFQHGVNWLLQNVSARYNFTKVCTTFQALPAGVLGGASACCMGRANASPDDMIAMQLTFDLDVRANVFEMNIRLLGGLLSAHLLAEDTKLGLMPGYQGGLLALALDLGSRLLPAFTSSPSGERLTRFPHAPSCLSCREQPSQCDAE